MSKEVKRYDCGYGNAKFCQGCYQMEESELGEYVSSEDYDALLAERDRLADALKEIDAADWSSSESATDFAISQTKGLLIGKMKRIARAALQGEQP